ncbi:hypothetical protein CVV38_01030 [Candidatus Peregrinibacteria bacterium HGW-Peregrinibacteria-1]|jgi:protein-disulfide isomerase|nr:MAG: hypothetical protein CVV38_01030 [Candidatus Peregrinibacteria bacterium HGW-Peregrinibacteria-1]
MNQTTKSTLIWTIAGLLIAVAIIAAAILSNRTPSDPSTPPNDTEETLTPAVSDQDWTKGTDSPVVTLVEYSDLQCPACANASAIVDELLKEFSNHMQFVYRHYPLRSIHPNAQLAGQAAEAAGKQGKFWEMHDLLFASQSSWSSLASQAAADAFVGYATELGLDTAVFEEDMKSREVEQIVNAQYDSAQKMGLSGTPTFFLNGEIMRNPGTLEGFRAEIRNAINNAQQNN